MTVEKFAVSFNEELAKKVRAEAQHEGSSLSGWLADAAKLKLRRAIRVVALADYEREFGAITDQELAEVEKDWPASP